MPLPKVLWKEELGEKLVENCLVILAKAVKLTKIKQDDKLNLKVVYNVIKIKQCLHFFLKISLYKIHR